MMPLIARLQAVLAALLIVTLPAAAQFDIDAGAGEQLDPPAAENALAPNLWNAGDSVLLSWLEPVEGEPRTFAMRFARLKDGAWSEPRTIAERDDFFANWADLPSITQHADGSLLAHWLQSSGPSPYAYDVVLARSTDDGESWTTLGPAHDDGTQTEHGFVSRLIEDEGVRLFWLDGREMTAMEGDGHGQGDMALRTAVITGETIGESIVLDSRVCECCNTAAAMTSNGPIIVYRDRSEEDVRDISIVRRVHGAWTEPATVHEDGWAISGCPVNGPAVAARGERVAVAWHTGANFEPRVLMATSEDSGATFGEPILIDGDEPLGRVDLVMDARGNAIVCWLAMDERGAAVRLKAIAADGVVGEPLTVVRTSPERASGFPRIGLQDGRLLIIWRDAKGRVRGMLRPHG